MQDYEKDENESSLRTAQTLSGSSKALRLGLIGLVPLCLAVGFAYAGGWLSPQKITPPRVVNEFQMANGNHPGFRRSHSKGLCASGWFDSNGNASEISKANLFAAGRSPVIGRFAFGTGLPFMVDDPSTVRSLALQITPPDGEQWRTGMINVPVVPFTNADAVFKQMVAVRVDPATGKADPEKMRAFIAAHPSYLPGLAIVNARQISSGFANTTYNSVDTFVFVDRNGIKRPVRWSARAVAPFVPAEKDPSHANPNALFDTLIADVGTHPLQWQLVVIVGQPDDPVTPNIPWPASRRQVVAGVVTIDKLHSEDGGGACTNINFDPMVLPDGIQASADDIPAARSAVYSRSFRLREQEHNSKQPSAVTAKDFAKGDKS